MGVRSLSSGPRNSGEPREPRPYAAISSATGKLYVRQSRLLIRWIFTVNSWRRYFPPFSRRQEQPMPGGLRASGATDCKGRNRQARAVPDSGQDQIARASVKRSALLASIDSSPQTSCSVISRLRTSSEPNCADCSAARLASYGPLLTELFSGCVRSVRLPIECLRRFRRTICPTTLSSSLVVRRGEPDPVRALDR
jgi:hypothetical protein